MPDAPAPTRAEEARLCRRLSEFAGWLTVARQNESATMVSDAVEAIRSAEARAARAEAEAARLSELVTEYASERAPEALETACVDRDKWMRKAEAAEAEVARLTAAVEKAERERDEANEMLAGIAAVVEPPLRDGVWGGTVLQAVEASEAAASDLRARVAALEAANQRLLTAFHDATRRPLGVTPDSGAEFYDQRMADEAEERRRAGYPQEVITRIGRAEAAARTALHGGENDR